ncbi:hypothetical protein ACFX2I_012120 [Malus domestica]
MLQNGTLQHHGLATRTEPKSSFFGLLLPARPASDTSLGSTQLCWASAPAGLPSSRLKARAGPPFLTAKPAAWVFHFSGQAKFSACSASSLEPTKLGCPRLSSFLSSISH